MISATRSHHDTNDNPAHYRMPGCHSKEIYNYNIIKKECNAFEKKISDGLKTIGPFNKRLINHLKELARANASLDPIEVDDAPIELKYIIKQAAERMCMDPNFFHYACLAVASAMFPEIRASMNKTETLPLTFFM